MSRKDIIMKTFIILVPDSIDLNAISCIKTDRTAMNDNTITRIN